MLLDSTRTPVVGGATPSVFTAMTDAAGHYAVTGLPAGTFAFGFQHDALNALGIESPVRPVALAADTDVVLDLSIPSMPAVRARICPGISSGDGLMVGYLSNAHGGAMPTKPVVIVRWTEVGLRKGKLESVRHQTSAVVDDDGRYLALWHP